MNRFGLALCSFLVSCAAQPRTGTQDDPTRGDTPGDVAGPSAQLEQNLSGTRIKARWVKSTDGAKGFTGWWDTTRDEECSFGMAGDGKTRCLPSNAVSLPYYADDQCTKPAGVASVSCTPPTYGLVALACGSGNRVVSVKHLAKFYITIGANCTIGGSSSATVQAYEAGAEIAATSFAEASYVVE